MIFYARPLIGAAIEWRSERPIRSQVPDTKMLVLSSGSYFLYTRLYAAIRTSDRFGAAAVSESDRPTTLPEGVRTPDEGGVQPIGLAAGLGR